MRKINRTYKFRLYPNKAQTDLLARHFGCARLYTITFSINAKNNIGSLVRAITTMRRLKRLPH